MRLGRGRLTVLAISGACFLPACDHYEPPCEVSAPTQVLREQALPNTVSGLTSFGRNGDSIVVSWVTYAIVLQENLPTYRPWLSNVAVVGPDGALTERQVFPLFEDLNASDVPEDNLGFCWTPSGLVVHWTEQTTVSAVGDPPSARTSLRLQHIAPDGHASPPFSPLNMNCVDCVVRLDSVCHGNTATVLFVAWPDDDAGEIPLRSLTWDVAADQTTSGPVDWLPAPSPRAPAPALRLDGDTILLMTSDRAWVVDEEMHFLGGPVPLPNQANRVVHWSDDLFEGTVVWSTASGATGSDGSDDVFLRRFDGFGEPLAAAQRLGASKRMIAMARGSEELGVVLRDGGHDAFALATVSGERLGGDVPLAVSEASSGALSGTGNVLTAEGPGRFVYVTGEPGRIQSQEIVCAR